MNTEALRLLLAAAGTEPANGSDVPRLPRDSRVLAAALRLAEANGLSYCLLRFLTRSGIAFPSSEAAHWATVLETREKFLRTITFLNEVAERFSVDYVMIKDCSTVDHVPKDVDVLVREDERSRFVQALRECGLDIVHDDLAETSLQGSDLLRIDVYARIRYLGRDFLDTRFLWGSRRAATTYGIDHPGLGPEAAYLLNSVHGLFGHGSLTLLDFLDLMNLQARVTGPSRCRSQAHACGWAGAFDMLTSHYQELRGQLRNESKALAFPHRFGTGFILRCVSSLDAPSLGARERAAFGASLLWDDLIFLFETSGLAEGLARSPVGTRLGNAMGHRLRAARGDRKSITERTSIGEAKRETG